MRIDSSIIGMESERRYTSSTTRSGRLQVRDYNGRPAHGTMGTFGELLNPDMGGSLEAQGGKEKENGSDPNTATKDSIIELRERVESMRNGRLSLRSSSVTSMSEFREYTIRYIFDIMFSGSSRWRNIFGDGSSQNFISGGNSYQASVDNLKRLGINANVLTVKSGQYYEESEATSFSTKGMVRTSDGREINFNVDVLMSRQFSEYFEEEMDVLQVNTCDPLVINFDGDTAELSDQKFFFDIDGDGVEDEISQLGSGSGYLALDKNGDGVINNGKELFGPESGNGFGDLSAYDDDGNGWIDENDAIWSKLKIWCKNPDGTDSLYTLADKGVGAICLQSVGTDFALNDAANNTNGYIRRSGIFLYENGNVGTVQHLDLAK